MSLRRVRSGELIALLGAAAVVVSLTLRWYQTPGGSLDAWDTFGPTIVLLIIAALIAIVLVFANLTERSTALPVAAAVWSTLFGLIAVICMVIRLLERPDDATGLCAGTWLAAIGAVAILLGSWQSMRDERPELYRPTAPTPRGPPV